MHFWARRDRKKKKINIGALRKENDLFTKKPDDYVKKFWTWRRDEATRAEETTWRRLVFELRSPKSEGRTMA